MSTEYDKYVQPQSWADDDFAGEKIFTRVLKHGVDVLALYRTWVELNEATDVGRDVLRRALGKDLGLEQSEAYVHAYRECLASPIRRCVSELTVSNPSVCSYCGKILE